MKKFISLLALLLVAGCESDTARYSKVSRAVVMVESEHGYGSGFVIRRENRLFVFTAAHVVSQCSDVKVHKQIRFENHATGESIFKASVIVRDDKADLAVLWLDAPPSFLGHVEFEHSYNFIKPGSPVYCVGNFYGPRLPESFSTGVVSQIGVHPDDSFPWPVADQMTCIIINGSSGGPVFDYSNHVVGVVVGTHMPGIEFFVPVRAVDDFCREHRVRWLMGGVWCPDDDKLSALRDSAKFVAPEVLTPVAPSTISKPIKPKTK